MERLPLLVCELIASHVRNPSGLRASNKTLRSAVDETATAIEVKADVTMSMLQRLVDVFGRSITDVRFSSSNWHRATTEQLRLLDTGCSALTGIHFHSMERRDMHLLSLPLFARLQRLTFELLSVTDIRALSSLTDLTSLVFSGLDGRPRNPADIGPLSSLSGLRNLSMGWHSTVDLRSLSVLTGLTSLAFTWADQQKNIEPLASLSGLRSLSMRDAREVEDLRALSGLTELTHLDLLGMDKITSFAPLAGLTALRHLELSIRADAGPVVAALPRLTSLRTLNLRTAASGFLANCAVLEELEAQDSGRLDINVLPVSLKKLVVWDSSAPASMACISRLTSLADLQLMCGTMLSASDVANVAQLSTLSSICFTECDVSSIDALRHLPALQMLDIGYTEVADLEPLASVSGLEVLDIRHSHVTSIRPLLALQRLRVLKVDAGMLYDGIELLSSEVDVVRVTSAF
jgi:Leucine-rich repeat (LRR) protein